MILLNFSHPLTPEQLAAIQVLAGQPIEQVLSIQTHFEHEQSFLEQLQLVLATLPISPEQWQTAAILVNPPALNVITALLLAELHGRMGYFVPILRLRPVEGALPPRFEVSEILNLQAVRDQARKARY
jgi:hypothetical protein